MKRFAIFLLDAAITVATIILLGAIFQRYNFIEHSVNVDTVLYYDTIQVRNPIPVDSAVVKYIRIKLPMTKSEPDSTKLKDSINITAIGESDSISISEYDSVSVTLPITQVEYKDSLFHAWVSGYNPKLDSIDIYKHEYQINRVEVYKPDRWSFGIQVGTGYQINGKIAPYIGLGIQYNLLSW